MARLSATVQAVFAFATLALLLSPALAGNNNNCGPFYSCNFTSQVCCGGDTDPGYKYCAGLTDTCAAVRTSVFVMLGVVCCAEGRGNSAYCGIHC